MPKNFQNSNDMPPLVSVVCLCYNHAPYLEEALDSVFAQTYTSLEVLLVDDGSTDGSRARIEHLRGKYPALSVHLLPQNRGNCAAFNYGLAHAKGKYIVDFATDDRMYPQRIARQVALLEARGERYGVAFSDTDRITPDGRVVGTFYPRTPDGQLNVSVPEGDVYALLVARQQLCATSMLVRRSVLDKLGGYDPSLRYEDYDFWVRSSRICAYAFDPAILTSKRVLPTSHGQQFYGCKSGALLRSTLRVCYKAFALNRTEEEHRALAVSVRYHLRLAFFTEQFGLVRAFGKLLTQVAPRRISDRFWLVLAGSGVRIHWAYRIFRKIRHKKSHS